MIENQEIIQILETLKPAQSLVKIAFVEGNGEQLQWKGRISRIQKRFVLISYNGKRGAIKLNAITGVAEEPDAQPSTENEPFSETEKQERSS